MQYPTTPRDREVLNRIVQGYSNAEIAAELGIAVGTVKHRITRLCDRHQIPNSVDRRVALAVSVIERGTADINLPALTPKRLQTIELVSMAFSNREIAFALGTTQQVVKNLLREIYDLTGCSSRLELAIWHCRNGIRRDTVAA